NQTVQATGGVTPYTWAISAGSLPAGLSINSATGAITGTPTGTGTSSFTVQVTDSESPTPQTSAKALSITINNSAPLQVTTTGMPAGVINTSYANGFLSASGGIQPYTWSISSGSLPSGLTLNTSTGQISGTPTATGTSNFTAKVTDSSSPNGTATASLSITINGALTITTTSLPNGSINNQYNATVNASGGITPYNWSVSSGSLPPGLNLNNNNSLSLSGQPTATGSYPFTLEVTDNQGDTASQSYTIVITTQPTAYTVSGTVTYSGSKTGWVYLELYSNNCNGCNNNLGTSISETTLKAGGAFTIHGVLPGTYTLQAFMDNLGYGAENASNPTATVGNITVTNSGVTGVGVALTDPGTVTINSAPTWKANNGLGAFSGGAFVSFKTITNNNGIELPSSYTVEWSTSASCSSSNPSKSFPAMGGNNPWIINGLTNGTTYYFCARGVAGSSTGPWSAPSSGITIGAPSGGNAVSGTVTFSETAKGPLYVGFYNQSTGVVYADVVGSESNPPKSPASYSVSVPTGSNYYFFGVIDQGNSGLISAPGQVSNTNGHNNTPVAITGTTTNEDLTLPSANSQAYVMTQVQEQINSNGTNTNYTIEFNDNGLLKLPVAVELATGPNPGAVIPADIAVGSFGGNSEQFSYWTSLNGITPKVGDSYTLNVTYSDGTSEVLTVTVGAVLNNAFVTSLSPQGTGVSVTPNFSWTDPANAGNYTYQFQLWDSNGNNIWQIPGNNSNSNGFSSSITSITWNVDPTNSGNLPTVSSLNGNANYNWQIQASDTNGDSAQVQVTFQTAATPLTLPAAGSLGSTVVGESFSGSINASGGVGPSYTFAVNGTNVPTDGSQMAIADGIWVSSTGGNTLSIGGTPSAIQTVTLTNVTVTDSASNSAGPNTYTITVSAAATLAVTTVSLPGGNKTQPYYSYVQGNGGVQPYTWSVGSGLPAGLSLNSQTGEITGTPTATGTSNFTITVTDSTSATANASLSISVLSCPNNSVLNGNYAFVASGWDVSTTTGPASRAGSFVANGSGSITGGLIDTADQTTSPGTQSGTFTGTYCVGSNNLATITMNFAGGMTGSTTVAVAVDSSDGNGHIISYDNNNTSLQISGLLRKQTTSAFKTSSISGNYAFGVAGNDQSANRFGIAGEFNSNGSGTLSGEADYDQGGSGGGAGAGNTTFSASDFAVASNGRGTASITFAGPGATINFVYYVVSSSEMLMMALDSTETPPMIVAGQVLKQSGSFTSSSLSGTGVIEIQGLDTSSSPAVSDVQVGLLVATTSNQTYSVTMDANDGGTVSTDSSSGTYSVASNGRVTITGTGNHPPVFYLIGTNQAFIIGTDSTVSFGMVQPQSGSNFTNASLTGSYFGGGQPPQDSSVNDEIDSVSADGSGTFTVTTFSNSDCSGNCGAGPNASDLTVSYAVSADGRVVMSCAANSGQSCTVGSTLGYLYIISGSQAVFMGAADQNPKLVDFHQ
ncbi:MAG: Ig domain-containing protein, partial [Terriglobales bacterium]